MADIVLLAHRIPWPPDKGDKIRSWHLLRHLAERHRVHLGAFVDDPADMQHEARLRELCADVRLQPLKPLTRYARAMRAVLRGRSVTMETYADPGLKRWLGGVLQRHPDSCLLAYSCAMGQYRNPAAGARHIVDFVDMDSDKWRQYGQHKRGPLGWIYRREARLLGASEQGLAAGANACLFVSRAEAAFFSSQLPGGGAGVDWYANGVDSDYFSPRVALANPYPPRTRALVFTGAMDYWPNADAACWFATEVLPAIQAGCPEARFYIVGSRPTPEVLELARLPGVAVTGRVPDVRPWITHAMLSVAPLRVARGVQNKVLEGMAMGKAVIATPQALEGIDAVEGQHLLVAGRPQQFAQAAMSLLLPQNLPQRQRLERNARAFVLEHHHWPANLARLDRLLEQVIAPPAQRESRLGGVSS